MHPAKPLPPLFPYTTLFRSRDARPAHAGRGGRGHPAARQGPRPVGGGGDRHRDRKSTRLNSSHTVISYAVFCLKTKSTNATASSTLARTNCSSPRTSNTVRV